MSKRGRRREGGYRSGREFGIIGWELYKTRDLVEPSKKRKRENERRSIQRTLDEHEEHDELPDS
jgi:hypothetical protein